MFSGKTVLVTGGTGFIGGRLVEKLVLEHRARVRVLVRNFARAARIAHLPIEMLPGDLEDPAAIRAAARGCEIVFHCAYDFAGTKDQQRRAAIESTRGVAEAALKFGLTRMVHVSSFSIYAPMRDGDLTEDSPWPKCKNSYVLAKRDTERLVRQLHRRQRLPVVILQPTLVYGPFSSHWTIAPIQRLTTGLVPLLNHGEGYCNPVFIDDRSEEHTSELQSRFDLVCRLLLEKKNRKQSQNACRRSQQELARIAPPARRCRDSRWHGQVLRLQNPQRGFVGVV